MHIKTRFLFILGVVLIQGCVMPPIIQQDDPQYAPVIPNTPAHIPPQGGSLFQPSQGLSLWNDQRARQVGDILTVVLEESTSSSKSSTSSVSKDSNINMPGPTLFGTSPRIDNPLMPSSSALSLNTELSAERESGGDAAANQQNKLAGRIP